MPITMQLGGLSATITALQGELKRYQTQVGILVQTAGINTEAEAKQACPVDTGRLRSSIKYTKQDALSCTVDTPVFYGPFVDGGTSRMAPQPFLTPAFLKYRQKLLEDCKKLAGE